MKRIAVLLSFIILWGLLWGCSRQGNPDNPSDVSVMTVVPNSADATPSPAADLRNPEIQGYGTDLSAKVPLEEEELLLQVFNINLDLDKNDEQILAVKTKGNTDSPIKIVVVDFDEIRSTFARSWERATQATNQRAVGIELQDVIGDYNLEIICRGVSADGTSTLDIFRKTISPSGMGLYFSSICALSSDRPIIIESEKRDQSYHEREKTGQAFRITVEYMDPESGNDLDIVKETWAWKYQEKRYIKILEEKIAGDKLLQQKLKGLFSSRAGEEDFKGFLNGPWHKTNIVDNIIFFDSQYDIISFYNGTILEVYTIEEILRGPGYSFSLYVASGATSSVKKGINVNIRDMDSILISVFQTQSLQDSDDWQGSYVRLSGDLQESLLQKNRWSVVPSEAVLSGIYRSSEGLEIAFEPPYFTWIDADGQAESGGFTLLANVPLLNGYYLEREIPEAIEIATFRFISGGGIEKEDRIFVIEYDEKKEPGSLTRTILLTPAKIGVRGALLTSKETRILEQTQFINEP